MTMAVITEYEAGRAQLYLKCVDGSIDTLQFVRVPPDAREEFVETLRVALSAALTRHDQALVDDAVARAELPSDPDRDLVLAFVADFVTQTEPDAQVPSTGGSWFPEQADGRDASGRVHASVIASQVVLLEVPAELFDDPQRAGWAIRDAINLARERLSEDTKKLIDQRGGWSEASEAPDQADWRELASQVRRLRRGVV